MCRRRRRGGAHSRRERGVPPGLGLVDESGGSLAIERLFAMLAGLRLLRLKRYEGSATSWADAELPGSTSFVVELRPGELAPKAALRQARAVLALARGAG